jgi:membrane protein YdbS with pleckstrin-like domain
MLRFVVDSPFSKKAETVSNLVFWLGASYLISTFLIETTTWFVFWAAIIMLSGVSLIVRAVVLEVRM